MSNDETNLPFRLRVFRCSKPDCKQFFRTLADKFVHETYTQHCKRCGFGYVAPPEMPKSAYFCSHCQMLIEPMPSERFRIA